MLKNNTPAFAANAPTDPAGAAERSAYQGSMLFTANRTAETDTWRSGLNNNVLVLGSSGCGKTRNHLKPNLLQAQGSYIVLDSKGILYREMAPYLRKQGYQVDQLDFVGMNGTLGYNPLDHIRCQDGHPAEVGHHRHRLRALPARRPRERPVLGACRRELSDQLHRLRP